jgi:hypothetical protein
MEEYFKSHHFSFKNYFQAFLVHYREVDLYMAPDGKFIQSVRSLNKEIRSKEFLERVGFEKIRNVVIYIIMQYHFYLSGNVYFPLAHLIHGAEDLHEDTILSFFPDRKKDKHNYSEFLSRKSVEGCLFDLRLFKKYKSLQPEVFKVSSYGFIQSCCLLIFPIPNEIGSHEVNRKDYTATKCNEWCSGELFHHSRSGITRRDPLITDYDKLSVGLSRRFPPP